MAHQGFIASPAGDGKVICCVCAEAASANEPMQLPSARNHVKNSRDHKRAVQKLQHLTLEQSRLESVWLAREQRDGLGTARGVTLARNELHLPEPMSKIPKESDVEFWEAFDTNSSDFTLELDPSASELASREAARINQELDNFGVWNDISLGYELGVQEDTEADLLEENRARDEEQQMEDALAGLLGN